MDGAEDPEALYDERYFNGGEYAAYVDAAATHVRNFRRKMTLLSRHGVLRPQQMRLLEIGCATGEFLRVARDAGVRDIIGIEPSAYCRDMARERGFEVLAPSDSAVQSAIASMRPNVLVAWDVWEHLSEPATVLDGLLAHCSRGLTAAISTVDAGSMVARLRRTRWRQFHPPTHLNYPTRASFRRLFSAREFDIAYHRSFGYYRPLVEYARALGLRRTASENAALHLPWTMPLYLNLWDVQLVIANRRT